MNSSNTPAQGSDAAPSTQAASAPSRLRSTLIRWSPALVGFAFAAGGVGGAVGAIVATSHGEPVLTGPDPMALLSDDIASLQSDVALLGQGLVHNLGQLGEGLDSEAARRAEVARGQLRKVSRKVDGVTSRLALIEKRQRAVETQLAELGRSGVTGDRSGSTEVAATSEGAGSSASAAGGGAEPEEAPPEPAAVAEVPEEAAPVAPAPRRGLFSFKLASGLDWNKRLRFRVISSLSRVGFDAKSTLHDFTGATTQVEGWLEGRLAKTEDGVKADIRAKAAGLRTGVDGRDEEMHKVLGVEKSPWIRFQLARFDVEKLDVEGRKLSGFAVGTLTISGVTKNVRVPSRLSVDRSRRLILEGGLDMRLTDFGIEPPSAAGGAISMEDELKIWLSLRLRSLGAAKLAK